MNPEAASLLEQLRDIHAAPAAPWWPPAPGWWILGAIVLVLLVFLLRRLRRMLGDRRRRRALLAALDATAGRLDPAQQPQAFLNAVNRAFKRVAIDAFPEEPCAGYQGEQWVRFVETRLASAGVDADLSVLATGPYRPRPEFDPVSMLSAARQWIRHYG